MIYQLGDIKFEPINGPQSFVKEKATNFAEQERLEGSPTLQLVGGVLTTIDIDITLHNKFGSILDMIHKLDTARLKGESLPLVNGVGYYEGEYVIERLRTTYSKTDNVGNLIEAQVGLSLREFVVDDPVAQSALKARKQGIANIQANPIVINPVPTFQSPTSLAMRDITATQADAASASSNLKKAASIPALAKGLMQTALRSLDRAKASTELAKTEVDRVATQITNAAALKGSLDSVLSSIGTITSNFTEANLPSIRLATIGLDQSLSVLRTTATQLTKVTVLRK